jgi:ATP-dependent Zn protease
MMLAGVDEAKQELEEMINFPKGAAALHPFGRADPARHTACRSAGNR